MNEIKNRFQECKQKGLYNEPILQLTLFTEKDIVTLSVSGDPDAEPDFDE